MSKEITSQNLVDSFPYALTKDDSVVALARCIADELQSLYNDDDLLTIYANINSLPESLLDILAKDYKVDWYLYDGTLETKRAQMQSCFYVHRHLGTKAAIIYALSDLCPGTNIEEWFEYNGSPYYFKIILDVTEQRLPIAQSVVERIVNIIKPARSILEENSIIYRSRVAIGITVQSGFAPFTARLCGTYPHAAVDGGISDSGVRLASTGDSAGYNARMCGRPLGSLM